MSDRCPTCGGRKSTWPPAAIIEACRKFADARGEPPTAADWDRATPHTPSFTTVRAHFGTWNAMIAAAGFTPRDPHSPQRTRWTAEQITAAIFEWKYARGSLPSYSDWAKRGEGRPTSSQVVRRFGSFNAGIVAAGYTPRVSHRSRVGYQHQAGMRTRQLVQT